MSDDKNTVINLEYINKPNKPVSKKQGIGSVNNGAIGVAPVQPKAAKPKPEVEKPKETIAVYSTRNVSWSGVGNVSRGYNIVTKAAADKWLTRDHIRLATPEEVAKEFGV